MAVEQGILPPHEPVSAGSPPEAPALETLVARCQAALDTGQVIHALQLADEALARDPDCLPARLARGEARLNARLSLLALQDFHRILAVTTDEAALQAARLGAARALEQQGEYRTALETLADLPEERSGWLRARLLRRLHGQPVVLVKPAACLVMHDTLSRTRLDTAAFHGYFAVRVSRVGRPWNAGNGWVDQLLGAGYEFVEALSEMRHLDGDPIFALRFIRLPGEDALAVALLVRVTASSPQACEACGLQLWNALRAFLPGSDQAYYFEAVADEAEMEALLTPFEPASITEIVRREEAGENTPYTVYPFVPRGVELDALCQALLRQAAPAMVSIHLLPTALMPWEQAALDRMVGGNVGSPYPVPVAETENEPFDPVSQWWKMMPRFGQAQVNRHLLDYLRVNAYVLSVNVAGREGVNPLLARQVASALYGTPRPVQDALHGGFELIKPYTDAEWKVAESNLQTLDVENWAYSAAPAEGARLRHLVTEREAALSFRLPIPGAHGVPGLPMVEVRPVAPPANLPKHGMLLGRSVSRVAGAPLPILQERSDRRRHLYVVGKTGTGKSTLLKSLALQDIEDGRGVCVIDPHGDLVEEILTRIPENRVQDVVLFDPADIERPIGLNLLEARSEAEKHLIVNEFIGLLVLMYDPTQIGIVGPRFQHNVRNAMLTAMAAEGSTLIEVVRVLTDNRFVQKLLPLVKDPLVRSYWTNQIANTSDFHKSEVLDYIVSKFSRFVGDERVRNIIGQHQTTLDFRQMMDERKVLLVNLSKGKIGPENAQFLGLLVVQRLLLTALSRADMEADQRADFMLYVDEFQNFATSLFATVLSEGRKYGIAATIANQYLTQLNPATREAIFGNIGSIVSFTLGMQDAAALAPEMYPVFGPDDLINLPKYTACAKLLVDGMAARPFAMHTLPDLRVPSPAIAAAIRQHSRETYGRDASEIGEEIMERFTGKKPDPSPLEKLEELLGDT
jgi:tetratricopeptide (TPR) repeat protein